MPRNIEIGSLVIDSSGSEYVYKGTHKVAGMSSLTFDLRHGGTTGIHSDPDQVAPAEVAEKVNLKDPRITVINSKQFKPRYAAGPWAHDVTMPDGTHHTGWHRTKRDGVAVAAHILAIADWHAQEEPQEEEGAGYFDAGLLVDAIKEHGLDAHVWQSGGGTAALCIKAHESHDEFLIGPGSYHWEDPRKSLLTTDELYYGLDAGEMVDVIDGTVAPGTSIPDAAKQIADAYKAHNKSEEN